MNIVVSCFCFVYILSRNTHDNAYSLSAQPLIQHFGTPYEWICFQTPLAGHLLWTFLP